MENIQEIQFVDPPKQWGKSCVVKQEPGTRWWTEEGPERNLRHWIREVHETYPGNVIPFQWVPRYVGVSDTAVHKSARTGRLTVLSFVVTENRRSLVGEIVTARTRRRYDYAILSECEQWREILLARYDAEQEDDKRR